MPEGLAPNLARRLEVRTRYLAGESMRKIACAIGISRSRVGQITKSLGLSKHDGGQEVLKRRGLLKGQMNRDRIERDCLMKWGITREMQAHIVAEYGRSPFICFSRHRIHAKRRGVAFRFTFQQWWAVWLASGKWKTKHRGHYGMNRIGDSGAYEVGNVVIRPQSENTREYHELRRAAKRPHPNKKKK